MASPFRFFILTFIVLVTLTCVTFVHGLWTARWVSSQSDPAILADLERLPLTVGAWQGKNTEQSADSPLNTAETNLVRRYTNQADGTGASILLSRGLPGPMVIKHLPTECYPSSGYEMMGQPRRFLDTPSDGGPPDEFWFATFKKSTEVVPSVVRVYWSWSATGHWQTPERPRIVFAPYSTLYKLYVIRPLLNENEEMEGSSVHEFIHELTREMRHSFFGKATL